MTICSSFADTPTSRSTSAAISAIEGSADDSSVVSAAKTSGAAGMSPVPATIRRNGSALRAAWSCLARSTASASASGEHGFDRNSWATGTARSAEPESE